MIQPIRPVLGKACACTASSTGDGSGGGAPPGAASAMGFSLRLASAWEMRLNIGKITQKSWIYMGSDGDL